MSKTIVKVYERYAKIYSSLLENFYESVYATPAQYTMDLAMKAMVRLESTYPGIHLLATK